MSNFRRRLMMSFEKKYTPVKYLESTGTQYIDTNVNCSSEFSILIENSFTTLDGLQLFGAYQSPKRTHYGVVNHKLYMPTVENRQTQEHIFNIDTNKHQYYLSSKLYKFDDKVVANGNFEFTDEINFYLFSRNVNGISSNYCNSKLYSVKIWISNTLVRDYVPVIDSSGIPCLYDKVEDKFYYNEGSGEFLYE